MSGTEHVGQDAAATELKLVASDDAKRTGLVTLSTLAAMTDRSVAEMSDLLAKLGVKPVGALEGATDDAELFDAVAVRRECEQSGRSFIRVRVPNLTNRRTFDIGGGRTATVRCAGEMDKTNIVYRYKIDNMTSDSSQAFMACKMAAWGIVSIEPNDPKYKKVRVPELGEVMSDEVLNGIAADALMAIAAYVNNGAMLGEDAKK